LSNPKNGVDTNPSFEIFSNILPFNCRRFHSSKGVVNGMETSYRLIVVVYVSKLLGELGDIGPRVWPQSRQV
jgi:hypothetical protein